METLLQPKNNAKTTQKIEFLQHNRSDHLEAS
jgi:hypothetical protein